VPSVIWNASRVINIDVPVKRRIVQFTMIKNFKDKLKIKGEWLQLHTSMGPCFYEL
jgi:hypothetical protein